MKPSNNFKVLIFSQARETRVLVGKLYRENNLYHFKYNATYLRHPSAISLGPELPLGFETFVSDTLFSPFQDRIPSKENPAYQEYCAEWHISPDEIDDLVLLTTIGHRGASSFLFRREFPSAFTGDTLKEFRTDLGLSVKDFALLVESEPATISRTENNQLESSLLLRFCELLQHSPSALEYQLDQRASFLHDRKIKNVKDYLHPQRDSMHSQEYCISGLMLENQLCMKLQKKSILIVYKVELLSRNSNEYIIKFFPKSAYVPDESIHWLLLGFRILRRTNLAIRKRKSPITFSPSWWAPNLLESFSISDFELLGELFSKITRIIDNHNIKEFCFLANSLGLYRASFRINFSNNIRLLIWIMPI